MSLIRYCTAVWISLGLVASVHAGEHKTLPDAAFAGMPITDPNFEPVFMGVGHEPDAIPALNSPSVLFVNFDATQINGGCGNDSTQDCSTIYSGPFVPFAGDEPTRYAIIQATREDVVDFGVIVVGERPPAGNPYAMVFVGTPPGGAPGGIGGVAPGIDCGNTNPNLTSFAFLVDSGSNTLATVIHQEAAHTWGLEHIDDNTDNLYPTAGGTVDPKYQDSCSQVVANTDLDPTSAGCNSIHTMFCQSNFQNSYQEMLALFGPPLPDMVAPTVVIDAPANGAEFDYEEDFDLVVTLDDDRRPQGLLSNLVFDDVAVVEDAALLNAQHTFGVPGGAEGHNFSNGEHTIRFETTDEAGNEAFAEITITIVGNPNDAGGADETGAAETGAAETGAGDGSGDDGGDDGGDDDGDGGTGTPLMGDGGDKGCACRADTRVPIGGALWAVGLLALRRRRR